MSDTELQALPTPQTLRKLMADLREAATTLTRDEARYLVDLFYSIQDYRIQAGGQVRSSTWAKCPECEELVPFKTSKKTGEKRISTHDVPILGEEEAVECEGSGEPVEEIEQEPNALVSWVFVEMESVENQIGKALAAYSEASPLGQWAESITGIGPILSAGLLAHIDITKAETAGAIWNFAGLNPDIVWKKGEKRPFNAKLRTLCWKIGESFVKTQSNKSDIYGKVYRERKNQEIAKNTAHEFSGQAAAKLEKFKIAKTTEAYKAYSKGLLPPAHVHARARRYATKLFLSHYHHVAYELHHKKAPPKPYIIEHGGHVHFLAPPNWPNADSPTLTK